MRNETIFVRIKRNGQWRTVPVLVQSKHRAGIVQRFIAKHKIKLQVAG